MLALKINIYNYFGSDHPEGTVKLERYYKIDKNMSVENLEKLIIEKTKESTYENLTYEIIRIEEGE